jgi:hypothetical protein
LEPQRTDRSKKTLALALCVPVVGLLELGLHFWQVHDVATDDEWLAARAAVEKTIQPADLLIFAPKWVDPIGRRFMGDALATIGRMAWDDTSRYPRAIEVSIRGAHRPELAGWKSTSEQRFGHVTVTTLENPSYVPVIDDPLDLSRMKVTRIDNGSERECTLEHTAPQTAGTYFPPGVPIPGDRFNCGGAFVAITVMPVLDYSPRRCIVAGPSQGMKLRVRFLGVKLGRVLHGNHGMYAENERDRKGAPVTVDFTIETAHIGRATHRDGDGWTYFEFPTHDRAGTTADVTAEIASSGNERNYCFEVTSR